MKSTQKIISLLLLSLLISTINAQSLISKDKMFIRIAKKNGKVRAIYNIGKKYKLNDYKKISEKYLKDNYKVLGIKKDLSNLKLKNEIKSPTGKHITYQQYLDSIPIWGGRIIVSLSNKNNISMVNNKYNILDKSDFNWKISDEEALNIVKNEIGISGLSELKYSTKKYIYNSKSVWFVQLNSDDSDDSWYVIVDANKGKIVHKWKPVFDYVNGSGKVFSWDPVTTSRDTNITYQSDLSQYYSIVPLNDLFDADASGNYYVKGKYAQSIDKVYPNQILSSSQSPIFISERGTTKFEEVNAYYHIDKMQRYIRNNLGYAPKWTVYVSPQIKPTDPYYIRKGDNIRFDVRYQETLDPYFGAVYFPQKNSEVIYFGSYGPPYAAEDLSLIVHEFGHALHDALINGGIESALPFSDTRGISEGIADYLAISYRRSMQNNPFRPNYRSNWYAPEEGKSILPCDQAKYPTNWTSSSYDKQKVWASTLMDLEYNVGTNPLSGQNLGRDVTTNLLLGSLSYVDAEDDAIDNIFAILQADLDLYNGQHFEQLVKVFTDRGFLSNSNIVTEINGVFSKDKTLAGNILVTGDVTVNSGVTLTILEGSHVKFNSGIKIEVNGTLNINGTSSNMVNFDRNGTSGTWGGIKYNSGSLGYINYANINNASTGIEFNNTGSSSITINNCNIENNSGNGISLYNSSPTIKESNINTTMLV